MMKILIFSDSHRTVAPMLSAVETHRPDTVLFLGDGSADIQTVSRAHPETAFYSVRGNNDIGCSDPLERIIELEGKRFFMAHGHTYGVKLWQRKIVSAAKEAGADILLYGHSHLSKCEFHNGMYIINPGSVRLGANGKRTYALVELQNGCVKADILNVT